MTSKSEQATRDLDLLGTQPFWCGTKSGNVFRSSDVTIEGIEASTRAFLAMFPKSTVPVRIDASPAVHRKLRSVSREMFIMRPIDPMWGVPIELRYDMPSQSHAIWYADNHFELHGAEFILKESESEGESQ